MLKTLEQYRKEYADAIGESIAKGNGSDYIVKFEVWLFCKFTVDYDIDMFSVAGKQKLISLLEMVDDDLYKALEKGFMETTDILEQMKKEK